MKVIWAAGTRSGSEFLIRLTLAAIGTSGPVLTVNSARQFRFSADAAYEPVSLDRTLALIQERGVQFVKLEEPTFDDWYEQIASRYPHAKTIGAYRPLHLIERSHQRLRDVWGFSTDRVVSAFYERLKFYEEVERTREFFLVDVANQRSFSAGAFLRFLDVRSSRRFRAFVAVWPVVNDLRALRASEVQYDGEAPTAGTSPSEEPEATHRYLELVARSNSRRRPTIERVLEAFAKRGQRRG